MSGRRSGPILSERNLANGYVTRRRAVSLKRTYGAAAAISVSQKPCSIPS
jgi:hypothetical protein